MITNDKLKRTSEDTVFIRSLCGGAAKNKLFIVWASKENGEEGTVREFNLDSRLLNERDAFRPNESGKDTVHECVHDVAYSAEFRSLFIATRRTCNNDKAVCVIWYESANNDEWNFRKRLKLKHKNADFIYLRVLPDRTVLCGQNKTHRVYVCRFKVGSCFNLKEKYRVKLNSPHLGFDATLKGNDRLLAAALWNDSLCLYRLDANQVWQISSISNSSKSVFRRVLFCDNALLVGRAPNSSTVNQTE